VTAAVREIDPVTAPAELLEAMHGVGVDDASLPLADEIAFMRYPPASTERRYWVAEESGRVVGVGSLFRTRDAPSAWAIVRVAPAARRRGTGTALLSAVRGAAADCDVLVGDHSTPEGAAFARAAGARDGRRDVEAVLDLATARLEPAPLPAGYRLLTWTDRAPDRLVVSYAEARNAMADAPLADGEAEETSSVERVREIEDALVRRGREARVTVALEGEAVVGFTELRVSQPPAEVAATDDTGVVATHRRRGVALAVKTESLRRLRAERPDVRLVRTTNAEENVAMRAVNARLGFVPTTIRTITTLPL
jgi:RimJ/RimL family protein N-acetyltransferase